MCRRLHIWGFWLAAVLLDTACNLPRLVVQDKSFAKLPSSIVYSSSQEPLPNIEAVVATRRSGIWAVEERGELLHSADDGLHWESRSTRGIDLLGMCESDLGTMILVGREGLVLRSTTFGADWARSQTGVFTGFFHAYCGSKFMLAAGEKGAILRSQDDGRTWTTLPALDGGSLLRALTGATDGSHIYVAGDAGHIYRSTDAGTTWTQVLSQSKSIDGLFSSASGELVLAVGDAGVLFRSEDFGEHWREIKTGLTGQLLSVTGTPDGRQIWVSGADGELIESGDRGLMWSSRVLPANRSRSLLGVTLSDKGTVIAAGNRECIVRAPGGSS